MTQTSPDAVDLGKLVAAAGDAIIVSDAGGLIRLWNPAAEYIFGFTEADALGVSLDLIIPERQRPRHWAQYEKTMQTGHTRYGHELLRVPALHKDGRTLSIAFTVGLIHDAAGAVSGVLAIVRDETLRWAEERALKKRLGELEAGPIKAEPV
jgi:PAS domain S-box-containing protein